jgi:hypothetical protein
MGRRRWAGWLGMLAGWLAAVPAPAQPAAGSSAAEHATGTASVPAFPTAQIPLEELPPPMRDRVRNVLDHPTLTSRGPAEAFCCSPHLYYWLVENPDQAVRLWRGLGAQCMDIRSQGGGRFSWQDPQAGEVHWETVLRGQHQRVWYAEGEVKPAPLLPAATVRAVLVLHHAEGSDGEGKPAVRHQIDLVVHTDSRALALAARLFGATAPRAAEQYLSQIEMFFGALAWYLSENPARAKALLEQVQRPAGARGPHPSSYAPRPLPGNG